MGTVTSISSKDAVVDLGVHGFTEPPCFIPMSTRASTFLKLGEGVEGIIPRGDVNAFISKFPEGYIVMDVTDELVPPYNVVIKEI